MEEQREREYKNLGNTIRESVFSKKDAPTMLPDETVEKLGLGEDDVLSMEENNDDVMVDEGVLDIGKGRLKHGHSLFDTIADFVHDQALQSGLNLENKKDVRTISQVLKKVDQEMTRQQKLLSHAAKGK